MKKATVGMVMLVSLVLIKAYISEDLRAEHVELSKSNIDISSILETSNLRADIKNGGLSSTKLIAQNVEHPQMQIDHTSNAVAEDFIFPVDIEENQNNVLATSNVEVYEVIEEVVPMDYFTNTGYGLLKTTTEQIISKNDRIGKEPLDNSNTISENISKMFPRSH